MLHKYSGSSRGGETEGVFTLYDALVKPATNTNQPFWNCYINWGRKSDTRTGTNMVAKHVSELQRLRKINTKIFCFKDNFQTLKFALWLKTKRIGDRLLFTKDDEQDINKILFWLQFVLNARYYTSLILSTTDRKANNLHLGRNEADAQQNNFEHLLDTFFLSEEWIALKQLPAV